MIIKYVAVSNLRCLRQLRMSFEPITAILGRNGVGKSCVLHALDIFYDTAASISNEDFYCRDTSCPIEITVTYDCLRPDEMKAFASYLSNGTLTVTKRISMEEGRLLQRYYGAVPQFPGFTEIRKTPGARDKTTAFNQLVDSGELPDLQRCRSAAEVESQMAAYEANHPDTLVLAEREEQFFGPPNVGGGKLDNYTKFLLVPAVKDVTDEFIPRRGSTLYQLLDLIVLRKIEAREDIARRKTEIVAQIKQLYQSDNLPELRALGADISGLLSRFFPGAQLVLDWDAVIEPEFPLPSAKSRLVEDGFEGDIDKKGHGLQRALLITLLQYLAQLNLSEEERTVTDIAEDGSSHSSQATIPTPSLVIAIEEPELYLHPLRSRYLSRLFSDLTMIAPGNHDYTNQVIFSSHSPYFVDLHRFESIRILRKVAVPDHGAPESLVGSFSIEDALRKMSQITGLDKARITDQTFKARIVPVMGTLASEGFFADAVVLVEGFGDAGILTTLERILGKDWLTRGVAVVPIEGKTKLDRPALIFQGLGIPTYLVFDGDKNHRGTDKEESTIRSNRILLRWAGATEEDFPASQVAPTWAVCEYNIEHELSSSLGKEKYDAFRARIAKEFGMDRPYQVLKNPHSSAAFTELVYMEGNSLPFFEKIVAAATNLVGVKIS